jgi:hypothetical protein
MNVPGELIPIVLFIMIGITALGTPIARALARSIDRRSHLPPSIPPDLSSRLDRMEQAIDAIAVEVERISEGQRFTTRLLSDRGDARLGAGEAAAVPLAQRDASRVASGEGGRGA